MNFIIEIGQKLENLGSLLQNLGYKVMPISFIAYFILRLLELIEDKTSIKPTGLAKHLRETEK